MPVPVGLVPTPHVATLDPEAMQQLQAVAPFVALNNQTVTGESITAASTARSMKGIRCGNNQEGVRAPPQVVVKPAERHGVAFVHLVDRSGACAQHCVLFN